MGIKIVPPTPFLPTVTTGLGTPAPKVTDGLNPNPPAATTPQPSDPGGFAMPSVTTMLTDQATLTQDRQTQELANAETNAALSSEATRKTKEITDQSFDAASKTRASQLDILSGTADMISRAKIAMKLSDSKNPLDHLQLWMLQQADPSFTAAGNTARLNYLATASDQLAAQGVIQQGAFKDQIAAVGNNMAAAQVDSTNMLAILSLRETQGNERIKAAQDLQAAHLGILKAQNDMQTEKLANVDAPTAEGLAKAAQKSPTGTTDYQGVTLSLAQIQAHQTSLVDVDYNTRVKAAALVVNSLDKQTLPQIQALTTEALNSKDGTALLDGQAVTLGQLQDKAAALASRDSNVTLQQNAVVAQSKSIVDEANKRILASLNTVSLNKLRQNQGVSDGTIPGIPEGSTFNTDDIQREITVKTAATTNDLTYQAQLMGLGDPDRVAADLTTKIQTLKGKAEVGSDYANYLDKSKSLIAQIAASNANLDPANDQGRAANAVALSGVQDGLQRAVANEAARKGGGDKDLTQLYAYTLQGQIPDEDFVRSVLTDKVVKGKDTSRWLSSQDSTTLVTAYNDKLSELKTTATQNGDFNQDPSSLKLAAADWAIEQVKTNQSTTMSQQLFSFTIDAGKNNPVKQVMGGQQFVATMSDADVKGIQDYIQAQQSNGQALPEEVMAQLNSGQLGADLAAKVAPFQGSALYQSLEKKMPGLGAAYTAWWNSPARDDAVNAFTLYQQSKAQTPQANAALALFAPTIPDMASTYAASASQSESVTYQQELSRQHGEFVTFGGSPSAKQIFLLDRTQGLTDTDRQQAYQKIFQPLLDSAASQHLPSDSTANFIEQALRSGSPSGTFDPTDPVTKGLMKKVLSGRDDALNTVDAFIAINKNQAQMMRQQQNQIPMLPVGEAGNLIVSALTGWGAIKSPIDQGAMDTKWYNDLQQKSP